MSERGKKLSGALRNDPKNKPTERLSPGVYRSAGGGLVTKGGRQIQRPTQAPPTQPSPTQSWRPMDTSFVGVNQATPEQLRDFANRFNNGAEARIGEIAGNVAADQSNLLFGNQLNPGASAPQFDPNNPNSYQPYPGQIQNGLGQPMTMPQMPQASANNGGRYRLSPGMYGTQQQAMNQYNQQMQQFNARLPAQLMKKY
jgi:hypothetical protein